MADKKLKVVLAYSGGLDTSIILKWLQTEYGGEVVTFTADLGQGEELEPARAQGRDCSASSPRTSSSTTCARSSSATSSSRCSAPTRVYEGHYLLGTSIARPLIAKRQIEIARQIGADAVAHGATGKGNDQVRFELGYYALRARHHGHRAVARMGLRPAARRCSTTPRSTRSRSPRTSAARRPFSRRRQPAALVVRGEGAGGPGGRAAGISSISAPSRPKRRRTKPTVRHDRFRARRPGRGRRRGAVARRPC